jgi:hypothetical protein
MQSNKVSTLLLCIQSNPVVRATYQPRKYVCLLGVRPPRCEMGCLNNKPTFSKKGRRNCSAEAKISTRLRQFFLIIIGADGILS